MIFSRKKPKLVSTKKPLEQDTGRGGILKQTKSNISSFIQVSSEIITSTEDEVIPVEKRIKNANVSKHGLYPHEVLVLDYASSYYTEGNSFQGFWWYKYGVKDVDKCLRSLFNEDFYKSEIYKVLLKKKLQQY